LPQRQQTDRETLTETQKDKMTKKEKKNKESTVQLTTSTQVIRIKN